jgi:hypothetical protein
MLLGPWHSELPVLLAVPGHFGRVTADNQPLNASASASETAAPAHASDTIFDNKVTAFDNNTDSIAAQRQDSISRKESVKRQRCLSTHELW